MSKINLKGNVSKTIKVLRLMFRISKKYMFTFLVRAVSRSVLPYISIFFSYKIIDAIIIGQTKNEIMQYVYLLIILNLIFGVLYKVALHLNRAYSNELDYTLERKIAMKTFELDYTQIEDNEVMQLIGKANDGSNSNGGLQSYTDHALEGILSSSLSLLYGSLLLISLFFVRDTEYNLLIVKIINHPLSFIIILLSLVFPTLISLKVKNSNNKKSYTTMMGNIESNRKSRYFYEICSNYKYGKDIRLYNMQGMMRDEIEDCKLLVEKTWKGYTIYVALTNSLVVLGNKILALAAYLYVGFKAYYELITVGNVVVYVGAITLISRGITNIITCYSSLNLFNSYLEHYFSFLNIEPKMNYGEVEGDTLQDFTIEFKNVSFIYPNQKEPTLKDVNLIVKPGEKIALVGKNGAGKTTLIKLLCRLYEPSSGEILINNIPLHEYSKEFLNKMFSVVFQDFKLFSYSIKENIMSNFEGDDDKVMLAAKQAGIKSRIDSMEKGIDTIIYQRNTEAGIEISGGEAQKIAIARALYKDSPIVILDEPTAALDPKSEAEIYEKFNALIKNKMSIFISHRMSSTKFCDRIVVLEEGMINEMGTHTELLKNNGIYSQMWQAQAKYYI
ncbi:ABC transporter ATP-binding protein [Mycoplasmatota bacterium WC30]